MTPIRPTEKVNRIMIVDRSEVARSIISHILQKEMQDAYIVTCESAEDALEHLQREKFDLITTSLFLSKNPNELDGLDLCHKIRASEKQHLTPVIVVSSDADSRLLREGFSAGVTDYFNKSLGYKRLVEFIKDVSQRHAGLVGRILYVEDSPVTAQSTQTVMERHGLHVTHVSSAEEAFTCLKNTSNDVNNCAENEGFDIIITDFFLEGQMTGGDLLYAIRTQLHYSRQEMPVLVITVEDNKNCQAEIFHAGANDFVTKPVIEEVLIARIKSLLLVKHQYNVLKRFSREMYRLATTDGLTGVRNKQFLIEESETFITRSPQVCLLMIDIDHFEIINAMQGYVVGDHILFHVGNLMNQFFADKNAIASRFVGKRFAVLLGDCPLDRGKSIAEEFRQQIMQLKPDGVDITISIGLTAGDNRSNLETMLTEADSALHNAQIQGYNRTSLSITCKDEPLT